MGFWKNDSEMHKSIKKGNHYAHLTPIQQSAYDAVVELGCLPEENNGEGD